MLTSSPVWVRTCLLRSKVSLKPFPQYSHEYLLKSLWVLKWRFITRARLKVLWHIGQEKGESAVVCETFNASFFIWAICIKEQNQKRKIRFHLYSTFNNRYKHTTALQNSRCRIKSLNNKERKRTNSLTWHVKETLGGIRLKVSSSSKWHKIVRDTLLIFSNCIQ